MNLRALALALLFAPFVFPAAAEDHPSPSCRSAFNLDNVAEVIEELDVQCGPYARAVFEGADAIEAVAVEAQMPQGAAAPLVEDVDITGAEPSVDVASEETIDTEPLEVVPQGEARYKLVR